MPIFYLRYYYEEISGSISRYIVFKRREKEGNRLFSPHNPRFTKIRHIGDYFADYSCKIIDVFTVFSLLLQPKEKVGRHS